MKEKIENLTKKIEHLSKLTSEQLLEECDNLEVAKLVLSLDRLLDKFGCHKESGYKMPKTYPQFFANKLEQQKIDMAHDLFMFLRLHKSIYDDACQLDILSRLSEFQKDALAAHYNGTEREFYKAQQFMVVNN